jgi:hypothetical protein
MTFGGNSAVTTGGVAGSAKYPGTNYSASYDSLYQVIRDFSVHTSSLTETALYRTTTEPSQFEC